MIENPFDAPIPGQSLTNTPGNYPWEHSPQFTDVKEASEYVWGLMHEDKPLIQIVSLLKEGVPVEALARMVLFGGFMEGKWTPDVAILLSQVVFKQIMAIGIKANVKELKLFMKDQSSGKFLKRLSKFKMTKQNAKENSTTENKAEQFAEKIKKELEEKENSGLMSKETD
jgi:hypothetical protein|tara:strand:- start:240 stop:749 length:510 start_codon:yes stop_codon:yes gene_type:complete